MKSFHSKRKLRMTNDTNKVYHTLVTVRYKASNLFTEDDFKKLAPEGGFSLEEFALKLIEDIGLLDVVDDEGEIIDIKVSSEDE